MPTKTGQRARASQLIDLSDTEGITGALHDLMTSSFSRLYMPAAPIKSTKYNWNM